MPSYRYYCKKCKKEFSEFQTIAERNNTLCTCGENVEIVICPSSIHIFPEGEWREMSYNGEHISSKKQLKEECYKRGMISEYYDIYPRSSGHEEEREEKASRKAKKKERSQEETAKSDNH